MFVIYISGVGYYLGSTYMLEGGYYPCATNRISEAKTYNTRKILEVDYNGRSYSISAENCDFIGLGE